MCKTGTELFTNAKAITAARRISTIYLFGGGEDFSP